jgi:hypothetical protein
MVHRLDHTVGDLIAPAQTFDPFFAASVPGGSRGFGFERKNRQGLRWYAKL